jgi:hypothetical protein
MCIRARRTIDAFAPSAGRLRAAKFDEEVGVRSLRYSECIFVLRTTPSTAINMSRDCHLKGQRHMAAKAIVTLPANHFEIDGEL